jgi:ParB family chromosome partitioning protein
MAKNLKAMLAQKLAENSQRHADAQQDPEFDIGRQHTRLSIELIDPNPYQPRRSFPQAELESLAMSISETGLLQPITVRQHGERYQLIAGERRWRAHKLLGRTSIETLIIQSADADMAVLALAENIDRQDLTDYEIGKALRQVETLFPSKKKLAESLGLNREDMYKYFAFEVLPQFVRDSLDQDPRLLSRSAAADIKRLLQQNENNDRAIEELEKAWSLLLDGNLEQTKLATHIARIMSVDEQSRTLTSPRIALKLARDGKQVGSISRDDRNFVVKLHASILSEEQADKLQNFVEQLLAEEV